MTGTGYKWRQQMYKHSGFLKAVWRLSRVSEMHFERSRLKRKIEHLPQQLVPTASDSCAFAPLHHTQTVCVIRTVMSGSEFEI